ncbi:phage tail protein [Neptunomonas marina]|uniref:Phage tail protein n=1 Tax=Neptunomonas marina TaxID=1815562 RepID=A0A437QAS0_9GAMM|nr:tail fiber protein [Neptunomonas marina]RVU31638.1 phage tail protein [Neptunomonas marina]
MSEPFLGEIRVCGFNFAPRGWAFCDGQILPINQNQSLYALLGTTYGGDGHTTFALPDLRGRCVVHPGDTLRIGQTAGEEAHALSLAEMPQHSHALPATGQLADRASPTAAYPAVGALAGRPIAAFSDSSDQAIDALASVGLGDAHENMQPYLAVNYIIALQGLFPSRN